MSRSARWDHHFLRLALTHALMSKDPSTRVGAILVGQDQEVLAAGFNGFPRRIADHPSRLSDRHLKYQLIVHAEMNAILSAARQGIRTLNSILYVAAVPADGTNSVWGGPPCTRCTVELIQAGITEIVSFPQKSVPDRWREDCVRARELIAEAQILYREIET